MNLQTFGFDTSQGRAFFTAASRQPRVLLIHGFGRRAGDLELWAPVFPDAGFLHLPGHGGAPAFKDFNARAWSQGLGELFEHFEEPPLLLGESLGAVMALSLPSRAVIAIEPLLSTDQLWPLWETLEAAREDGLAVDPALEALFAEPFDWVLDRIASPALVVAGAEPLLPRRKVSSEPSVLTEEDFARYAAHPNIEALRIPGGHALLDRNPAGVIEAARDFIHAHGFRQPPAAD